MERRRMFVGLGACALTASPMAAARAALPVPASGKLGFKVLRNGNPIGQHMLSFSSSGDKLTVTTQVALKVTLAGLTMFHYNLQTEERWQGDVFQSLDSVADYDGDPCEAHVELAEGGYAVTAVNKDNPAKSVPRYIAPPDTLPLTYWNKRMIYGPVLNIQTGHCYHLKLSSPGWNNLPDADGGSILAQRYDLSGKVNVSAWYDKEDAWSGLAFQKSGAITYEKIPA